MLTSLKTQICSVTVGVALMTSSAASAATYQISDLNTSGNVGLSFRVDNTGVGAGVDLDDTKNHRFSLDENSFLTVEDTYWRTFGTVHLNESSVGFDITFNDDGYVDSSSFIGGGSLDGVDLTATTRNSVAMLDLNAGVFEAWFYYAGFAPGVTLFGDAHFAIGDQVPAPVPLPASALLLLAGLGGFGALRSRKKAA